MGTSGPVEISPQEVQRRLTAGEKLRLIDVREPVEAQQASIAGAELIPMRSVPGAVGLLSDDENPIVVFCHHGIRSAQVVGWLREQGIENCASMAGGIDRWSLEIDARVARYG
jgi:rhodanese-related sulfurtransferase